MGDHISAEVLARFLSGLLAPAEARRVVRHLLSCLACQTAAVSYGRLLFETEEGQEPTEATADEQGYDAAIDRALASVLQRDLPRFEKERRLLDRLLAAAKVKPRLLDVNGHPKP